MLKLKQCCHSSSQAPNYLADVNDSVLVVQGRNIFKGRILSFPSDQSTELELHTEERITVDNATVVAVMLDD